MFVQQSQSFNTGNYVTRASGNAGEAASAEPQESFQPSASPLNADEIYSGNPALQSPNGPQKGDEFWIGAAVGAVIFCLCCANGNNNRGR